MQSLGYDPETDRVTLLFDPRNDAWSDHFTWDGAVLVGKTSIGRTTIDVLGINAAPRVEHRRLLMEAGLFPKD